MIWDHKKLRIKGCARVKSLKNNPAYMKDTLLLGDNLSYIK